MEAKGFWHRLASHWKEIAFVASILVAVASIAIASSFWPKAMAGAVRISHHGQEVTTLRLDVATTYELLTEHGTVRIEVKDHKAAIVSSPCPNQHCVKEGFKGGEGSSIVCVPEEVALLFLGEGEISELSL